MSLKIDEEFKDLLPPLTDDEYDALETSILREGIREPLIVWDNTIVDGHNRYSVAQEYNLDFEVSRREFDSREEAKVWMIDNQKGRRNLTDGWKWELAQTKRELLKEKGKENISANKGGTTTLSINDKEAHNTREEVAEDLGWSTGKVAQAEQVWDKGDDEVKDKVKTGDLTIGGAYKEVKKKERAEKRERLKEQTPDIPDGKYRVIYADPPWKYNDKQDTDKLGGAEKHYPTMSITELCDMDIEDISADNSVLFLWTTSPLLEDSFKVINAWGFKYKTSFIWDKVRHNMGHYNSVRHELLLVCTRGSCTPDKRKLFDSVQSIERDDKHSQKPKEFYNIIETLYTKGDKIELFSRNKRKGWVSYGNEVD